MKADEILVLVFGLLATVCYLITSEKNYAESSIVLLCTLLILRRLSK